MEGFKNNTKMQCFKEGGSVKYESRKEHKEEMSSDMSQDKKLIKKAFKQHDKAEHDKAPTEIKLKKGGRAKKELGSARKFMKPAAAPSGAKGGPNKYKVGGSVSNVYEAKKKSGDLDAIEAVKDIKPGKAAAPSKAAVISKNTPAKFCGGKSVKKMADGRLTGALMGAAAPAPGAGLAAKLAERELMKKKIREQYLGKDQQAQLASQQAQATAAQPPNPAAMAAAPPQNPMGDMTGVATQKKGGKVKKMNTGGTCS